MNVLKILKKQGVGLGLTLISILIIIFFHRMHVFDNLEAKIYDLGFRVRGPLSGWASREPIPKKTEIMDNLKENIWPSLESGDIKPIIDTVIPIEEVDKAHKLMESNQTFGKVILKVN